MDYFQGFSFFSRDLLIKVIYVVIILDVVRLGLEQVIDILLGLEHVVVLGGALAQVLAAEIVWF